jgi:hypothetical protein
MKRAIAILVVVQACRAAWAGLPPESFGGAFWGTMIGGLWGGNCHDSWSGKNAAIGAGIGLAVGTLAGESRRAEERRYMSAAPVYGYTVPVSSPPPVAVLVRPQPDLPKQSKTWASTSQHQIPDAPRVPDAPTF